MEDKKRKFIYEFLSIPFPERIRILLGAGLLRNEDEGKWMKDIIEDIISRADEIGDREFLFALTNVFYERFKK